MIVSFVSYKGGVGKSCMSRNLAVYLSHKEYDVCIIDSDESQATAKWYGRRTSEEIEPYVHTVGMTEAKGLRNMVKKQYEKYDIIVVDSPPSDKNISRIIMKASNLILIPITPTGNDELDSIAEMLEMYNEIKEDLAEEIPAYFIINRFDSKPAFQKLFIEELKKIAKEYKIEILEPYIVYRPAVYGEISMLGKGATEYGKAKSKARIEFTELAEKIIEIGEKL